MSGSKTFSIAEMKGISALITQAKKGVLRAQLTLANLYESDKAGFFDIGLAALWYLEAAQQGSAEAQVRIGELYLDGLGIGKSQKEAINWFRKAATQNNADALSNLAWCYQKGLGLKQKFNLESAVGPVFC